MSQTNVIRIFRVLFFDFDVKLNSFMLELEFLKNAAFLRLFRENIEYDNILIYVICTLYT